MAYGKSNMGPKRTVAKKTVAKKTMAKPVVSNKVKSVSAGLAKNKTTGRAVLAPARNKYIKAGINVKDTSSRNERMKFNSSYPDPNKTRRLEYDDTVIQYQRAEKKYAKELEIAKKNYAAAKKALNGPSVRTGTSSNQKSMKMVGFTGIKKNTGTKKK